MTDISTLDTATRIAAADDGTWYDPVAITLHWTTAVLVVLQMALAQTWGLFGRPARHLLVEAHMSFGICLAAVILFRVVWRLMPGHQVRSVVSGTVQLASRRSTTCSTQYSPPRLCSAFCYAGRAGRQ